MRKFGMAVCVGLALVATGCQPQAQNGIKEKTALENDNEKLSYAMGQDIGATMGKLGVDLDVESFVQGMRDMLDGAESKLSQDEARRVLMDFQMKRQQASQPQVDPQAAANNLAEGQKFLEENGKRDTVVTTASGLQYEIMQPGSGEKPTASSTVTVHYRGTLISGEEFDSSYSRGQPATFPLNGVIPGWTEGVQLMQPGAKFKFFIPANLAYGERGSPPKIGPNSTLVFEVELLEVK